jgi:hypothetical protein
VAVNLVPRERRCLPVVVVNGATASLLRAIFGEAVLDDARRLRGRVVEWSGAPVWVEEESWLVSEAALLARVRRSSRADQGGMTIYAGGAAPGQSYRFGRRKAAWAVADGGDLRMTADSRGWSFSAGLRVDLEPGGVPCGPRLRWPLSGRGWFACGTSAMAVDPICGDGVGYAVRGAVWLCALLTSGACVEEVASDYGTRLALAFRSHLASCLELYTAAPFADAWDGELRDTTRGIAAVDGLLARSCREGR